MGGLSNSSPLRESVDEFAGFRFTLAARYYDRIDSHDQLVFLAVSNAVSDFEGVRDQHVSGLAQRFAIKEYFSDCVDAFEDEA